MLWPSTHFLVLILAAEGLQRVVLGHAAVAAGLFKLSNQDFFSPVHAFLRVAEQLHLHDVYLQSSGVPMPRQRPGLDSTCLNVALSAVLAGAEAAWLRSNLHCARASNKGSAGGDLLLFRAHVQVDGCWRPAVGVPGLVFCSRSVLRCEGVIQG